MTLSEHNYLILEGESLAERISVAVRRLRKHSKNFDAIAFRGVSGALVAPSVAAKLGKTLVCVRKPTENTHSSSKVEGRCEHSYVIIDDFICEGETVRSIVEAIKEIDPLLDCYGVYTYKLKSRDTDGQLFDHPERRYGLNLNPHIED